jgi:hypothetical protein
MEVDNSKKDELAAVIEETGSAIRDPELDIQSTTWRRFFSVVTGQGAQVHEGKKAQAIQIITKYRDLIVGALRRAEYGSIEGILSKLWTEYRFAGLSQAPVEILEMDRIKQQLKQFRWDADEIDHLRRILTPGKKASRVNWWTITIDGRNWTREEIRSAACPHTYEMRRWLEHFRPIPSRAEIERQAETDLEIRNILKSLGATAGH